MFWLLLAQAKLQANFKRHILQLINLELYLVWMPKILVTSHNMCAYHCNLGIILPDANIDTAVSEAVLGSLSFNGQRCTALKILFVHKSIAGMYLWITNLINVDTFIAKFTDAVDKLKMGLPWQQGVSITPLAEPNKPTYLQEVINDCIAKGGKVVNARGGQIDRSFVAPTGLWQTII